MSLAPQPVGANWSNIFRTGGILLAVVGAAALWIIDDPFTPEAPLKDQESPYASAGGGARLSFDDAPNRGYSRPEPPKAPDPEPRKEAPPPPPKVEPIAAKALEPIDYRQQVMASSSNLPRRKRAAIAMIGGGDDAQQPAPQQPGPNPYRDEYRPGMSDGVDKLDNRMGNAAAENRWLASAGTRGDDFVTSPLLPPISRMMLRATTMIQATTIDASTSELPDDIGAAVDRDVLDSIHGKCVLIPYGSIIYGRTNNQVADFQTRGQGAITRILFPNGRSQNIGAMNLTDAEGRAGVEAEVDRHLGAMAASIAGAGFFAVLGQAGQIIGSGNSDDVTVIGVGGAAAGQQTSSIGQQLIQRQLNRPNTLGIPIGWPVAVQLTKDMALPPYVDYPNYPDCDA